MESREYSWQSPVECPNCKTFLHIRKVYWFSEYDYWYLFQCCGCSEERSGRLRAKYEYVPFWEEEFKVARRTEEVLKKSAFKIAKRMNEEK